MAMTDERWAIGEVRLWAMNTQSLYNNLMVDWLKNFQRKMKRGVFNIDLAVRGIADNFVPRVITDYNKNFPNSKLPKISLSGKYQLGRDFVNDIMEAIEYKEGKH